VSDRGTGVENRHPDRSWEQVSERRLRATGAERQPSGKEIGAENKRRVKSQGTVAENTCQHRSRGTGARSREWASAQESRSRE